MTARFIHIAITSEGERVRDVQMGGHCLYMGGGALEARAGRTCRAGNLWGGMLPQGFGEAEIVSRPDRTMVREV